MSNLTPAVVWLIILVVLIITELMTLGLTTIWFGAGALAAIAVALPGGPVWLQILVFTVVSLVLLFSTRPLAVKYFNKNRTKTNVESLIGREGVVKKEIDNLAGKGQVVIGGMEWTVRAAGNAAIPEGTIVVIRAVSGVKLIVEAVEKSHEETDPAAEQITIEQTTTEQTTIEQKIIERTATESSEL